MTAISVLSQYKTMLSSSLKVDFSKGDTLSYWIGLFTNTGITRMLEGNDGHSLDMVLPLGAGFIFLATGLSVCFIHYLNYVSSCFVDL